MSKLQVGVFGASGRVGRLLIDEIIKDENLQLSSVFALNAQSLSAELTTKSPKTHIADSVNDFLKNCACVIDFSSPAGSLELLQAAQISEFKGAIVCGTTGFKDFAPLESAAKKFPLLWASNMSLGVAVLEKVAALVASSFKSDIEIVEIHHNQKKDAPSGTALTLANACAKARGLDLDSVRISGRDGQVGARTKDEIGVLALRGGDVVGRHTIGFYAGGEFLELTHNATSRLTFALGAINALKWLKNQSAGKLYRIQDCLSV